MIFDTHAHYDDDAFNEDRDTIIEEIQKSGVEYVVNVSSSLKTCKQTIKLISEYKNFFGAIGVHPSDTAELNQDNFNLLKNYLNDEKVVAVGEIGLDYYWDEPDRQIQKVWFEKQLSLASDKSMPVIIHSRDAAKDTLDMMKAARAQDIGGVIHCFSYGKELAREYLNMGFYLGIGGVVTFKNARILKEVVEYIPLDRIVLETDCPYLAPEPYRGKRNNSSYIQYVIKAIAQIKNIDENEIERITMNNAFDLYRIPKN